MITDMTFCDWPTMSDEIIWQRKPIVEYADLQEGKKKILTAGCPYIGAPPRSARTLVRTFHYPLLFGGTPLMTKIWPVPHCCGFNIEREMRAYRACDGLDLTPPFLANLADRGRVIGFAAAMLADAHHPRSMEDKELCREVLRRFYDLTG